MKKLGIPAVALAVAGFLTKEDILFILGLIVTVINAVIEYLRYRREKRLKEEEGNG